MAQKGSAIRKKRRGGASSGGVNNAETFVEDGPAEDELFVDDVPKAKIRKGSRRKKKRRRASERRQREPTSTGTNTQIDDPGRPSTDRLNLAAGVLTCTRGPEEGLALSLIEGSYTIGRGKDNNFVLKDLAASRKHVRVVVSHNQVTVEDLGSGNGTRVNGENIEGRINLDDGDRIEIGDSELHFTYVGNDRSVEASALRTDPSERIAKAAEQLAAELSGKLRDEDYDDRGVTHNEQDSAASFLAEQDRLVDDALSDSARRRASQPSPAELWQETATKLPLSEVVATDQRLRGGGPDPVTGSFGGPLVSGSGGGFPEAEIAPPRPAPRVQPMGVPEYAQPRSSGGGAALWLLALVTVLLVAAIVVGGWWLWRQQADAAGPDPYKVAIQEVASRLEAKEFSAADAAAARALQERPGDPVALALVDTIAEARKAAEIAAAREAEDAKADEPEPTKDPGDDTEAKVDDTAATAQDVDAKVDDADDTKVEAAKPVVRTPKPRPTPTATKPKPKPTPRVRRRRSRSSPPPAPRGMDADDAKAAYVKAMRLVRGADEARGCALIKKVAREAPSTSPWKIKAKNAMDRYGCE